MSPTLSKQKAIAPISLTTDSSDEDLAGAGDSPRKRIHEKIMRKKFDAFTKKIRKAELKTKLRTPSKISKLKASQSLPPWIEHGEKSNLGLKSKANKVSIAHSKSKGKDGADTPFFTNTSMGSNK